jgi:DNA-binding CsgD family transcriptional regulator
VESAAHELASIGLLWDAARLAGRAAARSTDRKISARLLACARNIHPRETAGQAPASNAQNGMAEPTTVATPARESAALSERELEVATLVLEGKTYAEIGEAIYISPRTAEHHIAAVRRRLGATSRSDLMARLRMVIAEEAPRITPPHAQEESVYGTP